jgi:tetratricopeptide (TPR) repeat protein
MRGDAAAGEGLLKNLVAVRPDSSLLLRSLGELEFYSGSLFEGWQQVQQAHLLEPEDPVEIASLAKLWLTLGRTDEAEQLLEVGLGKSPQNYTLLNVQWLALLVAGRLEEAERLAREFLGGQGEEIPESLRRIANLRLGMLALIQGQNAPARSYLEAAIPPESESPPDSDTLLALTLAAAAAERNGDAAAAAGLIDAAERRLQRARVNGVDDAEIYYNEAAVLAMRGQAQPALEKLQQAYDRGFRELWMVDIDGRLDAVRGLAAFADFKARIVEDIDQCLAAIRNAQVASL